MSTSLCVYLGPYVECQYRDATEEIDFLGCLNEACAQYRRDSHRYPDTESWLTRRFCDACGEILGRNRKTRQRRPMPYDVLDGRERICSIGDLTESVIIGANIRGPRDFHPAGEGTTWDIATIDTAAEMRWFTETFAEDIAKLKTAYDGVTVKWGLRLYRM